MTELNADHVWRAIVEHTRRLAESAAAAGPDAAVPTTPEWTITDLVQHVGQTQHWVAKIRRSTGFDYFSDEIGRTGRSVCLLALHRRDPWQGQSRHRSARTR